MGSLFKTSVPQYSPVSYVSPVSTVRTGGSVSASSNEDGKTGGGNTSTTSATNTNTKSDEDSIRDLIRNGSRGRNSLIQTSYRGVLTDLSTLAPQRKNLLGE